MNRARALRIVVVLTAALALAAAAYFFPILDWIATAQAKIETYGAWAPVLYVFLYIVFTLCLVPGSALTFTAGVLYGPATGTAISLSASTIAACASFLVARYVARERVAKRLGAFPKFRALDRAVAKDAWKIVILMRLSPAFPYVLLNYAFGITRVRFITFALCSLVGMIPATLLLTSAAAALGKAADDAAKEMADTGNGGPPPGLGARPTLDAKAFREGVSWMRNRQLVMWRETEEGEAAEQGKLADLAGWLAERVAEGKATPEPRPGESPEAAGARAAHALRKAGESAREAERLLAAGRQGSARERQKDAAAWFLEARGDRKVINWTLWSALGATLLVTLAVGRMATRALAEAARETRMIRREEGSAPAEADVPPFGQPR